VGITTCFENVVKGKRIKLSLKGRIPHIAFGFQHFPYFFSLRQVKKVVKALFSLPSPKRSIFAQHLNKRSIVLLFQLEKTEFGLNKQNKLFGMP
jgi:hypothetical protein